MENFLGKMMAEGQNRAPNTIRLRNLYNDYKIDTESRGEEAMRFEDWAKINYPDQKILN